MNVGEALNLLHKGFKSIDLRAFVGRKSSSDSFDCIFLRISFGRTTPSSILKSMKIKKSKVPQSERFRLLFESLSIEYFSEVEKRIIDNRLSLENISFTISGINESLSHMKVENYISDHISSRYIHWYAINHRNPIRNNLGAAEDLDFNEVAMGTKFENLGGWFDMPRYVWSRLQPSLLVLFPIYIRRYSVISEKQHLVISYLIHKNLLPSIEATRVIINFNNGSTSYSESEINDFDYSIDNIMIIRKIKLVQDTHVESIDVYFKLLGIDEKIYQDKIMI